MLELLQLTEPAYRDGYLDAQAQTSTPAGPGPHAWGPNPPCISVLVPTHRPPLGYLKRAIASVRAQSYPHWQLVLVDDASADPALAALLQAEAADDPRLVVHLAPQHGHIARTTNLALQRATGRYVTFLDQDDELAPQALAHVAAALHAAPAAKLLYSDEDRLDAFGARFMPYFKPAWSPELLLGQNYICHLAVYDAALVRALGGLRDGTEGAQDHDLALRAARRLQPHEIVHVPQVLYHWRTLDSSTATHGAAAKPYALATGQRAVDDHVRTLHPGARAEAHRGFYRVHWPRPQTRQRLQLILLGAAHGRGAAAANADVHALRRAFAAHDDATTTLAHVDLLPANAEGVHASADVNALVAACDADLVVITDADARFVSKAPWATLSALLHRPELGCVTWKVVDADDAVVELGQVIDATLGPRPSHAGCPVAADGYFGRAVLPHDVAAVSRSALALRRAAWDAAGGLDPTLAGVEADVALCLRLRALGLRHVATPQVISRRDALDHSRVACGAAPGQHDDPWFSPHLACDGQSHALRHPVAATHPAPRCVALGVPPTTAGQ